MNEKKLKELLKSVPPSERKRLLWKLRCEKKKEMAKTVEIESAESFVIDMTEQPLNKALEVEVNGERKVLPPKEAMSLLRAGKAKLVRVISERRSSQGENFDEGVKE